MLLLESSAADRYYSCYECNFDSAHYFTDAIGTPCPSNKDSMIEEVHYVDSKSGKVEANNGGGGFVNSIVTYTIK